jgi:hypothetical protein
MCIYGFGTGLKSFDGRNYPINHFIPKKPHLLIENPFMTARIINSIGEIIPILIVVVTIGGLLFSFGIGNIDWAIKGLYLAIPAIISCLVFYDFKGKNINLDEIQNFYSLNQKSSVFIFYILFFMLITSVLLFPDFIIIFNVGITILYIIILLQILSKRNISPLYLLLEMMSLIALFFYKIVISVPLYFGNTDLLVHINYVQITYLTHHILPRIPPFVLGGYPDFPLYHIFLAEGMSILNLNSEIVIKSLTWPITVLLIVPILYLFFREITNNRQILLFSIFSLSIIISGFDLSQYMIPRGFAFFGFFLMLYILFKLKNQTTSSNNIAFTVCIIPVMVYLILVHHVTVPLICVLLLLLIVCEFIANYKKYFTNLNILFFICVSISYWIYFGYEIIGGEAIMGRLLFGFQHQDVILVQSIRPINSLSFFLVNNIESIIMTFLLILSIVYFLRERKINYLAVLSLFSLFTLLLFIRNPLQMVWQISYLFAGERFALLLMPFMGLMIGAGLFILCQYLIKKLYNTNVRFFILFCIIIVFIAGTLGFVYDDAGYPEKYQFDSSDLLSYNFILNNVPFNETIYSDYYTARYLNQVYFKGIENLGVPYYVSIPNLLTHNSNYTVFTSREFYKSGLILVDPYENVRPFRYNPQANILELQNMVEKKNKIYSNKILDMYYG